MAKSRAINRAVQSSFNYAIVLAGAGKAADKEEVHKLTKAHSTSQVFLVNPTFDLSDMNVVGLSSIKDILDKDGVENVFVFRSLDLRLIDATVQSITRKRRFNKSLLYLGILKSKKSKEKVQIGSRVTFEHFLYNSNAKSDPVNALFCSKSVLGNLVSMTPDDFSFDTKRTKYYADRLDIPVRTFNVDQAGYSKPAPSFLSALIQRVKTSLRWYLKLPLKHFITKDTNGKLQSFADHKNPIHRFLFASLAILFFVSMPMMSLDYGVTWDEKIENDYSKDVLNYFLSGGEDRTCFDVSKALYGGMLHYGMLFNLTAAVVNKYISPLGEFETKHILTSLTGFLAILFIGLTAKLIGGWRLGVLTMLFLFLSPRFLGHSMTNPKDIPFAAGYVIAVYAIIRFYLQLPKPQKRVIVWVIIGIALAIGIRIGGLLLTCYLAMALGLHWLENTRKNGMKKSLPLIPRYAAYLGIIGITSYVLGIITWPYALQAPLKNPLDSLTMLSNYVYINSYELFSGERVNMSDPPWNYIPEWIGVSMPLFTLIGAAISIPALAFYRKELRFNTILFCAFVMLFPLLYVIYKESMLYNGWRHFLFIAPYIALFGALGWEILFRQKYNKWLRIIPLIIMTSLVLKTAAWVIKNHPHTYVYFNELVGGIDGAFGQYETDYYGASMRAGIEWLVENEGIADGEEVHVGVNCELETARYWANKYSDKIVIRWNRHYEKHKKNWEYAMFTSRTMSPRELRLGSFPPKGTIHTIDVDNTPILAIIKHDNTFMLDGYTAFDQNDLDKAILNFQQAIEYDPLNEEAFRMLGMAYYSKRDYENALKSFDDALKIWPESYLSLYYKSTILLNQGKYQDCYDAAKLAIKHKNNLQGSHLNAASASLQLNLYEEARNHLTEAFKYSNNNRNSQSDIHRLMGQSYIMENEMKINELSPTVKRNNLQNAVNQLARAIELNPKNQIAYQFIIGAFEQMNDVQNANKYRQLMGAN